jgi:ribose transport system permease protein
MNTAAHKVVRSHLALSREVMQAFYRMLAVVLLCAMLAALSNVFLTTNNILNVLRQTALLFLMASGLTLVILTAGLDLSIGANVALSACLAASVIKVTGSPLFGVATGIGCGATVGLANGLLVTTLRIPSFIATYGMMWMLTGVTYYYMAAYYMAAKVLRWMPLTMQPEIPSTVFFPETGRCSKKNREAIEHERAITERD